MKAVAVDDDIDYDFAVEIARRLKEMEKPGCKFYTLDEVMTMNGLTWDMVNAVPDEDIE